jgi:steroid delta-isomerase-like uncharacterized protein
MKKLFAILPLVFLLCFMVGCQDKEAMAELEEFKAQAALEEANMELAMRFDKAWLEGDVETIREIVSSDYVWHIIGEGDVSLEEMLEYLKQQLVMYPDRTFSNEEIFAKGDKVVAKYVFRATHTGDTEDFPATGKKVEARGIGITRIENGKIVELWELFDAFDFYQQLGYELKPKEEK